MAKKKKQQQQQATGDMPRPLFDESSSSSSDSDDSSSSSSSSSSAVDNNEAHHHDHHSHRQQQLSINKQYAKEYMSRKQREELRRAEQEQGEVDDDDDSSSSSSEDEVGGMLTPAMDVSILKTINALRSRDERIYDPSTRFFPEAEEESGSESEGEDDSNKMSHKPKRIKDVLREQILEQMEQEDEEKNSSDDDDLVDSRKDDAVNRLVYDQEQKSLRSAFLESTKDSSDESEDKDWMVVKTKGAVGGQQNDDKTEELLQRELQMLETTKTGIDLKDPRGEVQDGEEFLLDFIKNRKWIDKTHESDSSDNGSTHQQDIGDEDDSIEQLEKTDEFEANYNFRFEEAAAAAAAGTSGADHSIKGFARSGVDGTLRRKDETRKQKRLERKERKAAERKAKEEQLRRLKNAKREEMEGKLKQIKSVLGEVEDRGAKLDETTLMKLMEGDYDPDKFEELMKETYGDDFYSQPDTEWKTDADVRESLMKDEDGELLVGQDNPDGGLYDNYEDDEGQYEEQGEDWGDAVPYDDDTEDAPVDPGDSKESEVDKKLRHKMQEELYKLDYEDIIAGMPTRFKYRKVEPNSYGLSTEEILFARDSTLKSFVSLKKMAPYREEGEHHVGGKKRRRFRDMMKQDIDEVMKELESSERAAQEEANESKKKRRRQKKGKKKAVAVQEASDEVDGTEPEIEPVSADNSAGRVEEGQTDQLQKKRRKKKGAKQGKDDNSKPDESESTTAEKLSSDAGEVKADAVLTKRKRDGSKKRKKKKAVSMEGVSASRLASYGL